MVSIEMVLVPAGVSARLVASIERIHLDGANLGLVLVLTG